MNDTMFETLQVICFGLIGFALGATAARKLRDVKVIPKKGGDDG